MRLVVLDENGAQVGLIVGVRRDGESPRGTFSSGSTGWQFTGKVGSKGTETYCQMTGNMVDIGSKPKKGKGKKVSKTRRRRTRDEDDD